MSEGERLFRSLVPVLILGASVLLAMQDPLRRVIQARTARHAAAGHSVIAAAVPIFLGAIYGGYFGGTVAQRADLAGQERRLRVLLPLGVLGGVVGGWLLLQSGERLGQRLETARPQVAPRAAVRSGGEALRALGGLR